MTDDTDDAADSEAERKADQGQYGGTEDEQPETELDEADREE